ncbi:MAG: hypothetical protein PHO31_00420 [Candidatus Pacebacteria bacterium]|nr:hypothetical protein [Candidatus Paceibacterota bacterium]
MPDDALEQASILRQMAEERVEELELILREFLPETELLVVEKSGKTFYPLTHDQIIWRLIHSWVNQPPR